MTRVPWAAASAYWLGMLLIAIVGGALRQAILAPRLGPVAGLWVETLLVCALFLLVARHFVIKTGATGPALWATGLFWVLLTVAFEFPFGHWAMGIPWSQLTAAYRFWEGHPWPLVLVALFSGPWLARVWLLKLWPPRPEEPGPDQPA